MHHKIDCIYSEKNDGIFDIRSIERVIHLFNNAFFLKFIRYAVCAMDGLSV